MTEAATSPAAEESDVPVTFDDGSKLLVPRSRAMEAVNEGATIDHQDKGAFNAAMTGLSGTIMGGILPAAVHRIGGMFSDKFSDNMSANYADDVDDAKANHPIAHMLGSGAGMLADAYGPIGKGASVVTRSATSGLGALGVGGALARVGGEAAGAAALQGVYEAGQTISDEEMSKDPLSAEHLFAAAPEHLKNILFAGAAGAALSGAGEVYRALKAPKGLLESLPRKSGLASDAIADEVAGVPGAGKGQREAAQAQTSFIDDMSKAGATREQATSAWSDPVAAYGEWRGKMNPEIAEALKKGAATQAASKVASEEFRAQQIAEFVKAGDAGLRESKDVLNDLAFGMKGAQIEKTIEGPVGAHLDAANLAGQEAENFLARWGEDESKGGLTGFKALEKHVTQYRKDVASLAERAVSSSDLPDAKTSARLFQLQDGLKRVFGRLKGMKSETGLGAPRFVYGDVLDAERKAAGEVTFGAQDVYDRMRLSLEDKAVFGRAGELQAAINAPFASGITNEGSALGKLTTVLKKDGFVDVPQIHSGKAASFLDGASRAEGATDLQSLRDVIDNHILRANELLTHAELEPAQVAILKRGQAAMENWRKVVDDTVARVKADAHVRSQIADEGHGLGHGLLGRLTDPILRPINNQMALEHAQHVITKTKKQLTSNVDTFAAWKRTPYRGARPDGDQVAKEIAGIREAAAKPEVMADRTAKFTGGQLTNAAPRLSTSIATISARAVSYLASQAPQGRAHVGIMSRQEARQTYTEDQLDEWSRKAAAIKKPGQVVEDAQHGLLSRESINAIRAVYPSIYARMQQQVQDKITTWAQEGKLDAMPYEQKLMFSILLDAPADETMTHEFTAAMQASKAPDAQAQKQGKPAQAGGGAKRPLKVDASSYDPNPTRT